MLKEAKDSQALGHAALAERNLEGTLGLGVIAEVIQHELKVFWGFTWRDWSASVVPGAMYTLAALRSLDSALTIDVVARGIGRSVVYFLLFIYAFDLANQINGVAEDKINKPDRPIASGLSSLKGAYMRWHVTNAILLFLGAAWGVLPWAALWIIVTIYTSFYGGDKHWATKNLVFMSVGSFCVLQSAWGLGAPIGPQTLRWDLILSGAFGIVASIQDMRDAEGDRIAGRRTLPIILGNSFRPAMAIVICAMPAVCWKLDFLRRSHWMVGYCGVLLTLAMFYMAQRVVRGFSARYDHKTYMILTYIFCGCVAVPMLFP
ncbi:unnamed protein product [Mycena citricolor]|uniref:UbiA prenyltransferase n=1 Tax=Mycena citricolor TaxID=2018698 RepID=A0AAD2Q0A3_9AGAR|nr:unnamed protein product [Mycena citricolor]